MKKLMLGAGLLLAATAAGAQVAPDAQSAARDGIQTRSEAVDRTRTMFARVDADRDGFITAAETQALRGQRPGGQRMGRRGSEGRATLFDRLDANRDNVISREEWTRAEAARGGMRNQRMAMRARAGGGMLRRADANNDRRVSLAEAEAAAMRRFDRVDLNRDGQVTADERQQARQQWQARPPAARN